jgi:hypothetical protein
MTPANATSLISCRAHCAAQPLTEDLNLRGRLENTGSPMYRPAMAAISGVASRTSSAAIPASGQPKITRGVSPHASVVDSPADSSASQMAGTSSIRTQCSWMFCRSVTSAVPRAYRRETSAITRSCPASSWPPSIRIRSMKNRSSSSSGSSTAVLPPPMAGRRWVYSPYQRNRPRRSAGSMESKPYLE